MRVHIGKASDFKWSETREIKDLAELLALIVEFNNDIVIGKKFNISSIVKEDYDYRITIYDGYLE